VRVGALPAVSILSTGDELVGIETVPSGSRIRETNSWSLLSLLRRMGIEPRRLGIARDDPAILATMIREGLRSDVLILSGGVSMGEYDLVGGALREAGCLPLFERVAIQPGKPLFFGVIDRISGPGLQGTPRSSGPERFKVVFGLPGNPVSSIVDFLVFARPALRVMMGAGSPVEPMPSAEITEPIRRRPGRRGYIPARVEISDSGHLLARPLPSMGSADLVALSRANALLVASESDGPLAKGARLPVLFLDDAFLR
jgi:molybdopterin molybdotransferase